MKATSTTAISGISSRSPGSRFRAFVRSMTVTLGSFLRRHESCPYPTSTANTLFAPKERRTSVKPPDEAPISMQTLSLGSVENESIALRSLSAPLLAHSRLASTSIWSVFAILTPAFVILVPATLTSPARIRDCARLRLSASPLHTISWSSLSFLMEGMIEFDHLPWRKVTELPLFADGTMRDK